MAYWIDQPIDISKTDTEIKIIDKNILKKKKENLPDGFRFKTLGLNYLEEIYGLLNNHYIEDEQHIIRLTHSKDFIYWYLKYIPAGFIVGLTFKNKLVGLVTATFIDMVVYEKEIKVPYINFLCIQSKIRKLGLAPFLMDEIKERLCKINMTYAIFTGTKLITKSFCATKDFVVPINYPKLKEIGFLMEDLTLIPKLDSNPLHLMVASDIDSVVPKLNKFMEKFSVKPFFTNESAHHFLLPKKNILYSFVNRNNKGDVTDFISVYKNYLYCLEKNTVVYVAQLAFYYHETMNLTQLVANLIDKLSAYKIDQLIFKDVADNMSINITKFSTYGQLYHFFFNVSIKETSSEKLCFYPF
jgi:hypothetical protein